MAFDMFESAGLENKPFELGEKMSVLRKGFESSIEPENDSYLEMPGDFDSSILHWLGTGIPDSGTGMAVPKMTAMDITRQMYSGIDLGNGTESLGLKEVHNWKVNPDYYMQNLKQHAGYGAEIIGTAKENLQAEMDGTGITTYRADDRPDLFQRNDQYCDKIRVNSEGEIIDRIQVKFVGKDAADCLSKLTSQKYDKYFNEGMIDKMEVPKDYYDGIKQIIPEKVNELEKQLQSVEENGKGDATQKIENQIARYKKIDEMLEKSTVSSDEAMEAVKHPRRYTAKLFAKDTFVESHKAGMESAAFAVVVSTAVSVIDNVRRVMDGEITAQEAFADAAKDTAISGGLAYGTAFVSSAVARSMSASCHQLIRSLGSSGIPAAAISFGVQSFDSVEDFASGVIGVKELVYDLGENMSQITGSIAGAAVTGALVGSVVPGTGTAVGFMTGMVGGMVGCALASEAYTTAVEFGAGHIDALANTVREMADKTIEIAREVIPDQVDNIAASINEFLSLNNLPVRV